LDENRASAVSKNGKRGTGGGGGLIAVIRIALPEFFGVPEENSPLVLY